MLDTTRVTHKTATKQHHPIYLTLYTKATHKSHIWYILFLTTQACRWYDHHSRSACNIVYLRSPVGCSRKTCSCGGAPGVQMATSKPLRLRRRGKKQPVCQKISIYIHIHIIFCLRISSLRSTELEELLPTGADNSPIYSTSETSYTTNYFLVVEIG